MSTDPRIVTLPLPEAPGAIAPPPLSPEWRAWVAENAIRSCTPQSMQDTMTRAGMPASVAAAGIQAVLQDPIFQAAIKHQQITRKFVSVMLNHAALLQHDPAYDRIERRAGISRDELFERYCLGNRPVILTDLARDWPAMTRWTPQHLRQRFGDIEVEVQAGRSTDPHYEVNKAQHRRRMRFGEFMDRVTAGPGNDLYLTANNEALRDSPLRALLNDIGTLPDYLVPERLDSSAFLWIGAQGTVTPLHHDTVHLLHLQVQGRKRWRFISPMETPLVYNVNGVFSPVDIDAPDLSRYPAFAQARVLDVVVEPGEAIFLPLAWWHHVVSLDTCISLSLSNLRLPNQFEYANPTLRDW